MSLLEETALKEIVSKTVGAIFEGIKNQLGPSKKELKVKIDDLEKQIQELNKNNEKMSDLYDVVIDDLCEKIGSTYSFSIEADTICILNNSGQLGYENNQENYFENKSPSNSSFKQLVARMNENIADERRKFPRGIVDDYTD